MEDSVKPMSTYKDDKYQCCCHNFVIFLSGFTCTIAEFETFSLASGFESNSSFECFGGSFLDLLFFSFTFVTDLALATDLALEVDSLAPLSAEKMRREP